MLVVSSGNSINLLHLLARQLFVAVENLLEVPSFLVKDLEIETR